MDFSSVEERVFSEVGGRIYIGGQEVQPHILSLLKDQAYNFVNSQLYEIIDATCVNESANLALIQSGKSGDIERDVMSAKMLYHWNFVMKNILKKISESKIIDKR